MATHSLFAHLDGRVTCAGPLGESCVLFWSDYSLEDAFAVHAKQGIECICRSCVELCVVDPRGACQDCHDGACVLHGYATQPTASMFEMPTPRERAEEKVRLLLNEDAPTKALAFTMLRAEGMDSDRAKMILRDAKWNLP